MIFYRSWHGEKSHYLTEWTICDTRHPHRADYTYDPLSENKEGKIFCRLRRKVHVVNQTFIEWAAGRTPLQCTCHYFCFNRLPSKTALLALPEERLISVGYSTFDYLWSSLDSIAFGTHHLWFSITPRKPPIPTLAHLNGPIPSTHGHVWLFGLGTRCRTLIFTLPLKL